MKNQIKQILIDVYGIDGRHENEAANRISKLFLDIQKCYTKKTKLTISSNVLTNEKVQIIDLTSDGVPYCVGKNFEGWVPILKQKP